MRHSITASCLLAWQVLTPLTGHGFSAAAESDVPSFRRANITTTIADYDHCETKCVASIETGQTSGCQGLAGDDCSFPFEVCPNAATQCFGPLAVCVDNDDNGGGYHCECRAPVDEISVMDEILVQDCRDRVTEVCEKDREVSLYAFCTNGGECVDTVEPGEPHPGCYCPGRFVGRHCEKRRGTGSEYRIEPNRNEFDNINLKDVQKIERRGLGASMSILMVVLSAGLAGFLSYAAVLYKRFRSRRNAPPAEGDDHSKEEMSIHVPPQYGGGNDSVSALEMQ